MSRLYYPPVPEVDFADATQGVDIGDLSKKVAKLIPSELITGYSALISLSMNVKNQAWHPWLFGFAFFLCLILTPVYLARMGDPGKPKRNHLITSTIAFAIWAYFISGQQVFPDSYDAALASIILVVFSLTSAAVPLNR